MTGTVKFYNTAKGFGFIKCNDSTDEVFFHVTDMVRPFTPEPDDPVCFELVNATRGMKAVMLRPETADD